MFFPFLSSLSLSTLQDHASFSFFITRLSFFLSLSLCIRVNFFSWVGSVLSGLRIIIKKKQRLICPGEKGQCTARNCCKIPVLPSSPSIQIHVLVLLSVPPASSPPLQNPPLNTRSPSSPSSSFSSSSARAVRSSSSSSIKNSRGWFGF